MSPLTFKDKKNKKQKISMISCYDTWSAKILSKTNIDILLVGDSLAMVIYGHDSTLPADVSTMVLHTQAVKKGANKKFIIADMPFMGVHKGLYRSMQNIERLIKAGANAVKIEGCFGIELVIQKAVQAGVPVMGHLGLTPQFINQIGGFKVQGTTLTERESIIEQAKQLENLGCFAVVLECVPASLAKTVTSLLKIPTIGIGAGGDVDGQVLVLHDLLGVNKDFVPQYLRTYMKGHDLILQAVAQFDQDVKNKKYPDHNEKYE